MARAGLYRSEVEKARNALLAQGRHPSVDAVRVALGNTGSKTTIHKYLKELDAESGGAGRKVSLSDALQDLVERLAAQLSAEADERIAAVEARAADAARQFGDERASCLAETTALNTGLKTVEAELQKEKSAHVATTETWQREALARAMAEQQVADLKERLFENDTHLQSLEEKHVHARDALEHYRQSVKEQRDQEQRRHEQQVQQLQAEMRQLQQGLVVRQETETRLHQEGARLVAELSQARQALYDQQVICRRQEQTIEQLRGQEHRAATMEAQLVNKNGEMAALATRLDDALQKVRALSCQVRELELALATSQATLAAQQGVAAELRNYLGDRAVPGGPASAP